MKNITKKLATMLSLMLAVSMVCAMTACGGKGQPTAEVSVEINQTTESTEASKEEATQAAPESTEAAEESSQEEAQAPAQEENGAIVVGEGQTVFTFNVVDGEGTETVFEVHTDAETVGAALLACELIAGEDSEYGLYVKTVNGITADYNVDQTYWAFYINGEYAMTGVDSTNVVAGDTYTFKVEK